MSDRKSYPVEDEAPQTPKPEEPAAQQSPHERQVPEEEHHDGEEEPHENYDDVDEEVADVASETPTERYERSKRAADGVWFSGFLSGSSYLPHPKKIKQSDLSETEQEELLEEATYVVPRGYKYKQENLPDIINPAPQGAYRLALILYLILGFVAWVFLLCAACPIPWYRGKNKVVDGQNYNKRWFTLYIQKGAGLPSRSLRAMRDCPIEKQFMQTISAATIIGCGSTLISLICALNRLRGKGGYGAILLFSFLGFMWSLCGNAMSISAFHLSRCNSPRFVTISHLDAGFALSLIAWIFLLIGFLILVFTTKFNVGPSMRHLRVMDSYYFVLLTIGLILTIIGNVTTIWKRRFNTADVRVVRVSYWHTELIMGNGTNIIFGRAMYRCSAYNKRIKASVAFLILGSIATFLALILAVPAHFKAIFRVLTCVLGIVSSAFLFISWVTAVAVKYRTLCKETVAGSLYASYPGIPSGMLNGRTKFEGYGLQEGVILVIIAWVIITLAIVLNFAIKWPAKRQLQ